MSQFNLKYDESISGTLCGWDRLVFRGTLRTLCYVSGMMGYLYRAGVLLKNFGEHAQVMTARLIEASIAAAEEAGRPVEYLQSSKIRKDEYARNIALDDNIQAGLICVLTCVEPCKTYEIYRNRGKKMLELKPRMRKCKVTIQRREHRQAVLGPCQTRIGCRRGFLGYFYAASRRNRECD